MGDEGDPTVCHRAVCHDEQPSDPLVGIYIFFVLFVYMYIYIYTFFRIYIRVYVYTYICIGISEQDSILSLVEEEKERGRSV